MKYYKIVAMACLILFSCGIVFSADFTFTIPDEKLDEYVSDFCYIYPNPEDSGFTDAQWTKERIKEWIIDRIKLGKSRKDRDGYIEPVIDDID